MTYSVSYKKVGSWFWTTLSKVKGDLVAGDMANHPRVFILEDETRVEVPTEGMIFKFSKERYIVIKQNMDKEAGK